MIFETHCHLNDQQFENDIEEVLLRAKENHVSSLCIIGWDEKSSLDAISICKKYAYLGLNLYPVVGLHPENVVEEEDKDLNWLKELLESEKILAIGEIGIDLHYDKESLDLQKYYFDLQLNLAKKYNLPVIIHTRDAIQITYDMVKLYKNEVFGIFHCYSGSKEMAKLITNLGYKLGIGGVVTFKNSHLDEVVSAIDIKNFVCETDCPYLAPTPNRGKRNEPSNLIYIVDKIAIIKGMSAEVVENLTFENAKEILRIK
ncbi:MAG: TatD family hydrolase [Bacilli bacterium]|nr:TatD family hydrolase [Bacilli bacterium]